MPAAVIIILAVLVGAIWLLVKILQGIGALLDQAAKSFDDAVARRKQNRYAKVRDSLRPYVSTEIPSELDSFEKK